MTPTVAIVRCLDYSPRNIAAACDELLAALGGMEKFARPQSLALVKPNLLTDADPRQAKTTHPEVVRALIRLLRKAGADVVVGDSPAKAVDFERVWERTGYAAMCAEERVEALRFEQQPSSPLACGSQTLRIAAPVLQADLVVNVPKVKTHILTTFTGAVKNLYGTLPGYQKTLLHRAFPTPAEFGRLPAALYARIRPRLNVADAVVAMEGAGPSGGDPIALGFLAASADAVALDTALCAVLGIDARRLPWSRYLPPDSLAALDPRNIAYKCLRPEDVRPKRFRVPTPFWPRLIPGRLVRLLGSLAWIRPQFGSACIRCGRCVTACCNHALSLRKSDRLPVLTPALCVACCCCHEVCPAKAITMQPGPLLRWTRTWRKTS